MLTTDWTDDARTHRVIVREGVPEGFDCPDYVDSFAVRRRPGDERSPDAFARAALEDAPEGARTIVRIAWGLLRFRLGPMHSPAHVLGWRIVRSDAESAEIAADGPWGACRIVVRDTGEQVVATTFLFWRSPIARSAWVFISPVHRLMARFLLDHATPA